jgi:hypothetical protein
LMWARRNRFSFSSLSPKKTIFAGFREAGRHHEGTLPWTLYYLL